MWSGTQYWDDYVFVSPDPEFIYNDATLGAVVPHSNATDLASGESYTGMATVTLPAGISGTWYVYVFTDRDPVNGEDVPQPGAFPDWPQEFQSRVWDTDKTNSEVSTSLTRDLCRARTGDEQRVGGRGGHERCNGPIGFHRFQRRQPHDVNVICGFYCVYIPATDSSLDTQDELLGTFEHSPSEMASCSDSEVTSPRA